MWTNPTFALMGAVLALAWGPPAARASVESDLQAVVDAVVDDHPAVSGASLAVDAPQLGLFFEGAAGRLGPATAAPMQPRTPFRIASTTKPFTAAAILRLAEQGRLSLDDTIAMYLPAELVNRINVIDGVNHGPTITLRELLRHRAGIYSHDEGTDYTLAVGAQPAKRWTPEEQVQWAIDHGKPICRPDACWHYSDTGFVMLGMVIMKVAGKDLGAAFRELLPFERLKMSSTWHELLEPPPAGALDRAHSLFGPADLYAWNPSFDSWGGGGLDASAGDLTRFIRGLFEHRVLGRAGTLKEMLTIGPADDGVHKDGYGMGIGRQVIEGVECFGHPGFWSSTMVYCPSLDLAFAGSSNQAEDGSGPSDGDGHTQFDLENGVVRIIKAATKAKPAPAPTTARTGSPKIRLTVRPRRVRSGRRTAFEFHVTFVSGRGKRVALPGADVRIGGHRGRSDRRGRAQIRLRFSRAGDRIAYASKRGYRTGRARVRVIARNRR